MLYCVKIVIFDDDNKKHVFDRLYFMGKESLVLVLNSLSYHLPTIDIGNGMM